MLAIGGVLILWGMLSTWLGTIDLFIPVDGPWNNGPLCEKKDNPLLFTYLILCIYFFGVVLIIRGIVGMFFG